jgi:hypothetical protein
MRSDELGDDGERGAAVPRVGLLRNSGEFSGHEIYRRLSVPNPDRDIVVVN